MEFDTVPRLLDIPTVRDPRGTLSILDHTGIVPFEIARTYWIYDVPSDAERHGHAFYSQHELIVAISGSFDVRTVNRSGEKTFHLNRPYRALYIPPLTWRTIDNFSTLSNALVLSSSLYSESDYIRRYENFLELING